MTEEEMKADYKKRAAFEKKNKVYVVLSDAIVVAVRTDLKDAFDISDEYDDGRVEVTILDDPHDIT